MATMVTVHASPIVLVGCADAETSEGLTAILESWHYAVEVAASGAEALVRLTGATPPAMAMLDMDLPVVGGAEIAAELRRRRELRPGWVILMSRQASRERVREALESGCDDFLRVPADAGDLKVRIRVAERVLALAGQVQKQSAELRYHATHDGLTGLWNREALLSLIFQETDRVQRMRTPLSLMLLDLDDFSRVNHDYGYEAGDRLLEELANRFRRQLRSYDLIGRCGEDEFLLALPGCTLESAKALAGRIREFILARPFAVGHEATTLTASIGVATSRGRSPLIVLREAERGLAEAKLGGKNRVCGDGPEVYVADPTDIAEEREMV
ncbi:MAG TPA: diguanylate cyclase [Acidobacteriaceae bacterium]|jgi:diguanylate cyclase (GGDEF)-like protein|nr:diguanylate cyclase [Acidobacteriaceae bacterium]